MITIKVYNLEVIPGTRNHKGSFVPDTVYKMPWLLKKSQRVSVLPHSKY